MSQNCSVFGCNNTYNNTLQATPPIKFYRFPGRPWEKEKLKIWVQFAKRQTVESKPWTPTTHSRICSSHFVGNEKSNHPHSPSFHPTIHPVQKQCKEKEKQILERYQRLQSRHQETIPEQDTDEVQEPLESMKTRTKSIGCQTLIHDISNVITTLKCFISSTISGEVSGESSTYVEHHSKVSTTFETKKKITRDVSVGGDSRNCFEGFESLKDNENGLLSLTSVKPNVFQLLLHVLPKDAGKTTFSPENKLLICLMKIKLGISFCALAAIFNVHPTTISRIFFSTLQDICERTKGWIFWPSKEAIQETMPECFKINYPSCRVIIDCTEVRSEKPTTVQQQNLMYSNYKNSYTVKFLVGITPGGLISFVSKAYGGRSSDTFITTDSGLISQLEPGDLCLADKGFPHIKSDCEDKNVILVMPPFADSSLPQFTKEDMDNTYKIASVRIHVERMIQRIKIYNILNTKLTVEMLPHIDNVVHMCCILANLQPPIIKSADQ